MKLKNTFGYYIVAFQKGFASKRNSATSLAAFLLCFGILTANANAQKGVGEATGVASQSQKPQIVTLAGKVVSIKSGPCEATTGRAFVGTHILLETPGKELLNIHLGPAAAVAEVVKQLPVGEPVEVHAFRTG